MPPVILRPQPKNLAAVQLLYSNDQILRSAQYYIIKFVRPIK